MAQTTLRRIGPLVVMLLVLAAVTACSGSQPQSSVNECELWDRSQIEGGEGGCRLVLGAQEDEAALDVNQVAYTSDGRTIYMLAYFLEARDAATGERLADCEACREQKLRLEDAVFDELQNPLAISSGSWLYPGSEPLGEPTRGDYTLIFDMAYAQPMEAILVAHDKGITWHDRDLNVLAEVNLGMAVHSAAVSPDGQSYTLGLQDGSVVVQPFAEKAGSLFLETSGTPPRSIAYSPNGGLLAAGDDIGQIFLWSLPDGSLIRKWPAHGKRVDALAFAPDGGSLASGSIDNTVVVWRLDEATALHARRHRGHVVRDLAFSPDGAELAVALGNSIEENFYEMPNIDGDEFENEPGRVVVWRLDTTDDS
jgi:WD domain, G-beta repeat